MTAFSAPIAEAIWDMKYRFKDASGTPLDETVEDSWRRVARALAEAEADPAAPVTLDMISSTYDYAQRADLIRNFVKQDPDRAALVVRDLLRDAKKEKENA